MTDCPYCGNELEESFDSGRFRCKNKECLVNEDVLEKAVTFKELSDYAEKARLLRKVKTSPGRVLKGKCPCCDKEDEFNTFKDHEGNEYAVCVSCKKNIRVEGDDLKKMDYESQKKYKKMSDMKKFSKTYKDFIFKLNALELAKSVRPLSDEEMKSHAILKDSLEKKEKELQDKWKMDDEIHDKRVGFLGEVLGLKDTDKNIDELEDADFGGGGILASLSPKNASKIKKFRDMITGGSRVKEIEDELSPSEKRKLKRMLSDFEEKRKTEKGAAKGFKTEEELKESSKRAAEIGDEKEGPLRAWRGGRFGNQVWRYGKESSASIVLMVAGIILGTWLGWPFLVALTAWAARNILPTPGDIKIDKDKDFESNRWGSLFAKGETKDGEKYNNRTNTGLATIRSLLKIVMLFFFGWGFFSTELPFRGLLLLVFFFSAYFSLPGEFSSEEPYKFMEGVWRPFIAFILSFVVFWGVFKSIELAWLCMAFFAVLPIAKEKENIAMAIGQAGSGIAATYENVDKIIFVVLMVFSLISMGIIPGLGAGGGLDIELGTVFGNIFFPFWIVALIGGFTSPANVRPYTGVVMIVMVSIFFAMGPGEQIMGQGFFGVWWPTVHNSMMSVLSPMGEAFGTLGSTFGSTFMLLTNPVGYAHNIMEGGYERNPTGLTGAYGVEIEQLNIPAIYTGTDSIATFNVKNVGPADAQNVKVTIGLPPDFHDLIIIEPEYYHWPMTAPLPAGKAEYIEDFATMEPSYAVPLFFIINARSCDDINYRERLSRLSERNMYIRVNVTVEYNYTVDSWMPLELISTQEWRDRTARNTFATSKVISHISTSPAKLSIGSFEQPIVAGAGRPFYIGINMSSAEGPNSEILWTWTEVVNGLPVKRQSEIMLEIPKELADNLLCRPLPDVTPRAVRKPGDSWDTVTLRWYGETTERMKNTAIFCTSSTLKDLTVPSKTYYIRAKASFRFRKWEIKDTLFAFDDVCISATIGTGQIVAVLMDNENAYIANATSINSVRNPVYITRGTSTDDEYMERVLGEIRKFNLDSGLHKVIVSGRFFSVARSFRKYLEDADPVLYAKSDFVAERDVNAAGIEELLRDAGIEF